MPAGFCTAAAGSRARFLLISLFFPDICQTQAVLIGAKSLAGLDNQHRRERVRPAFFLLFTGERHQREDDEASLYALCATGRSRMLPGPDPNMFFRKSRSTGFSSTAAWAKRRSMLSGPYPVTNTNGIPRFERSSATG